MLEPLEDRLAVAPAMPFLLLQNRQGYWVGELQGDSILESEYLLLKFILGQETDPDLPKIANYLRNLQNPDGGWSLFPGGPSDLSGTVKAYFALKLMGDDPDAPHMHRARRVVLSLGGAEKCNSFTKFYFAALGQISYDACPSIPPEIVFLPKWFYFNLYHVSAWTRTMILPAVVRHDAALHPATAAGNGHAPSCTSIALAANRVGRSAARIAAIWRDIFLRVDQLLKAYDRSPLAACARRQ